MYLTSAPVGPLKVYLPGLSGKLWSADQPKKPTNRWKWEFIGKLYVQHWFITYNSPTTKQTTVCINLIKPQGKISKAVKTLWCSLTCCLLGIWVNSIFLFSKIIPLIVKAISRPTWMMLGTLYDDFCHILFVKQSWNRLSNNMY